MCFGSSIKHVRTNLMYPDNHGKGVVIIKQKKEIESELTTPRGGRPNWFKVKSRVKFLQYFPKDK